MMPRRTQELLYDSAAALRRLDGELHALGLTSGEGNAAGPGTDPSGTAPMGIAYEAVRRALLEVRAQRRASERAAADAADDAPSDEDVRQLHALERRLATLAGQARAGGDGEG